MLSLTFIDLGLQEVRELLWSKQEVPYGLSIQRLQALGKTVEGYWSVCSPLLGKPTRKVILTTCATKSP